MPLRKGIFFSLLWFFRFSPLQYIRCLVNNRQLMCFPVEISRLEQISIDFLYCMSKLSRKIMTRSAIHSLFSNSSVQPEVNISDFLWSVFSISLCVQSFGSKRWIPQSNNHLGVGVDHFFRYRHKASFQSGTGIKPAPTCLDLSRRLLKGRTAFESPYSAVVTGITYPANQSISVGLEQIFSYLKSQDQQIWASFPQFTIS